MLHFFLIIVGHETLEQQFYGDKRRKSSFQIFMQFQKSSHISSSSTPLHFMCSFYTSVEFTCNLSSQSLAIEAASHTFEKSNNTYRNRKICEE